MSVTPEEGIQGLQKYASTISFMLSAMILANAKPGTTEAFLTQLDQAASKEDNSVTKTMLEDLASNIRKQSHLP